MNSIPITALIIAKNEELAIGRCVSSVLFCDQVIVVDSASTDLTWEIAAKAGAQVVTFEWNGRYPKKKQWSLDLPQIRHDWVLLLDADEFISDDLRRELEELARDPDHSYTSFDIPLAYYFAGRRLRHGRPIYKRSLLDRRSVRFPEIADLDAPGGNEVEGHYQPNGAGKIGRLTGFIEHDDPGPVSDWIERHNRYSSWEAYLRSHPSARQQVRRHKTRIGRLFDYTPAKPLVAVWYFYVVRLGFLDGRAGWQYAKAMSFYYFMIDLKTAEARASEKSVRRQFEDVRATDDPPQF